MWGTIIRVTSRHLNPQHFSCLLCRHYRLFQPCPPFQHFQHFQLFPTHSFHQEAPLQPQRRFTLRYVHICNIIMSPCHLSRWLGCKSDDREIGVWFPVVVEKVLRSESIGPGILKPGTWWKWAVTLTPQKKKIHSLHHSIQMWSAAH